MNLSLISQLKHITQLYKLGCVIIPCCDDTMLFNTNMINEVFELVNLCKLDQVQLKEIVQNSIEAIFDEDAKEALREEISKIKVVGDNVSELPASVEEVKSPEEVKVEVVDP